MVKHLLEEINKDLGLVLERLEDDRKSVIKNGPFYAMGYIPFQGDKIVPLLNDTYVLIRKANIQKLLEEWNQIGLWYNKYYERVYKNEMPRWLREQSSRIAEFGNRTDEPTYWKKISIAMNIEFQSIINNVRGLVNNILKEEEAEAKKVEPHRHFVKEIKCVHCDKLIPHDSNFCCYCGVQLSRKNCRNCGNIVLITQKFCSSCGASTSDEKPPAGTPISR